MQPQLLFIADDAAARVSLVLFQCRPLKIRRSKAPHCGASMSMTLEVDFSAAINLLSLSEEHKNGAPQKFKY